LRRTDAQEFRSAFPVPQDLRIRGHGSDDPAAVEDAAMSARTLHTRRHRSSKTSETPRTGERHMNTTIIRTILGASLLGLIATTTTPAFADPVKIPQTIEEHTALAKEYQKKAAGYRQEAKDHEAMKAAYKNGTSNAQEKRGQKNPWVVQMEKHCDQIIKDSEKLAVDNEKAADFHTLRAKELQGK
jgi:hypothetical protein